ncbi:MAG: 3-phosphoglycerate dehydrogenase [Deltaproteobacteria bacterium]|nr:3-phosphoglycerate dehydrogenase [Deltaproteobacteria bacterium]MBW2154447.1 3-phosphoglycerate dehydrogenase [Deltaproteobacteria bacterium]
MSEATIACSGPIGEVAIDILKPYAQIVIAKDGSEDSLLQIVDRAIGLILRGDGVGSARVIEAARNLKVIGRSGVGYDNVDLNAANARKIPVVITPGANAQAVAEAAIAFMLALCKKMAHWDKQLKKGNWKSRFEQSSGDLDGSTLGIIGFGSIGQKLAELIRPFGMTVLAYDPFIPPETAEALGARLVELNELLKRSDFVSIHASLNDSTRGLINRERLGMMKRGAFLVNLARGALIESLDILYDALNSRQLAGVGLDVFDPEPPDVAHPIFKLESCLTSPHAMAMTNRAMFRSFKSMAGDMAAVFEGKRPRFVANPEVLP